MSDTSGPNPSADEVIAGWCTNCGKPRGTEAKIGDEGAYCWVDTGMTGNNIAKLHCERAKSDRLAAECARLTAQLAAATGALASAEVAIETLEARVEAAEREVAAATARAGEALEEIQRNARGEAAIVASKEARRLDAFYERGRAYGYSVSAGILERALRAGGGR